MKTTIFNVLRALNEIDVRGERNHDLLLYAIQQLKPLQSMQMAPVKTEDSKQEVK